MIMYNENEEKESDEPAEPSKKDDNAPDESNNDTNSTFEFMTQNQESTTQVLIGVNDDNDHQ